MILVGAWLAIVGYGVLYAGVFKLAMPGQVRCSLRDAFTGQCRASGGNQQTSYQPQTAGSLPASGSSSDVYAATSQGMTTAASA